MIWKSQNYATCLLIVSTIQNIWNNNEVYSKVDDGLENRFAASHGISHGLRSIWKINTAGRLRLKSNKDLIMDDSLAELLRTLEWLTFWKKLCNSLADDDKLNKFLADGAFVS